MNKYPYDDVETPVVEEEVQHSVRFEDTVYDSEGGINPLQLRKTLLERKVSTAFKAITGISCIALTCFVGLFATKYYSNGVEVVNAPETISIPPLELDVNFVPEHIDVTETPIQDKIPPAPIGNPPPPRAMSPPYSYVNRYRPPPPVSQPVNVGTTAPLGYVRVPSRRRPY